ncbi:MAG TPA: nucleotidyltransferase family protein [Bryobacteraceae bacterium]|nr:nucleotidyltransferase family protein [Bryobacteraceae bacterium]
MNAAAIILAAGESRRMGRPKASLPFRGGTFLSAIAENLGRRCSPVIAVFGFDAARVSQSAPEGVIPVENPDYAQGMLTSLKAGLRAVPDTCDRVIFTLVDHPAVLPSTVDTVMQSSAAIAIPRFENRRGHPVLIRRRIADEFLSEPLTSKVRDVIDRHASEIQYVEVDDPGISDDIDDPALYEKLLAREAARI